MRHLTCTAVVVATLAFGTVAASTTEYREKPSWLQLTQATETPREETGVPAPSEAIATVLDEQDVMSVLGLRVRSSAGEDMGRIINVVVDGTGQVRAAVIDFGGFLGVGARKIAVDWNALHFAPAGSKDDRKASPRGKRAAITRAREADRNADLARRRARQELAQRNEVGIGSIVEPMPAGDELVAEIPDMRDRSAK